MEPLNSILTGYPSFQPNQVLTSKHLNDLADYLEQQHRLTRQKLIGIGIVCGLNVQLQSSGTDRSLTISRGVGITSEGYLICLTEDTVCTHIRPFENRANYPPFIPATDASSSIQELLTASEAAPYSDSEALTNTHLSDDKIVVLYLEILETAINKCLDESCDEKGKRWNFAIRKLLIAENHMRSIIQQLNSPGNRIPESYFNLEYDLPSVYIQRFGYVSENEKLNLSSITTLDKFLEGYDAAIRVGAVGLAKALDELYISFRPLFNLQLGIDDPNRDANPFPDFDADNPEVNSFTRKLLNIINDPNDRLAVQYVYDHILDLKATYEELADKLFDLNSQCCPDSNLFPRHLMLGRLRNTFPRKFAPEIIYPPEIFRHHFTSASIYNDQSDLLLNIKQLMQRLVLLIEQLDFTGRLDGSTPLKITPSKDCSVPLGKQAIPFYYSLDTQFLHYWDFETSKRNWTIRLLGYDTSNKVDYPLLYDICEYPKLRIEGHVGMELQNAITQLKELRQEYNLPFELMTLKLNASDNYLLADNSQIADLQGQYLVLRNELVCCLRDLIEILQNRLKLLDEGVFRPLILYFFFVLHTSPGVPHPSRIRAIVEHYFPNFYDLYIQSLSTLAEQLPPNLKEFNIERFQAAHNLVHAMSTLVKSFINTWGELPQIPLSDNDPALLLRSRFTDFLSLVLNYVELFLDQIGENCLRAKFETLYGLFIERVERVGTLSRFTQEVQGLEHIAGTTKGGTFILVYEDRNPSSENGDTGMAADIRGLIERFKEVTEAFIAEQRGQDDLRAFYEIPDAPPVSYPRVNLERTLDFVVVGDFYLPQTVTCSCLETTLKEICPETGRNNLPDLEHFVREFSDPIRADEEFIGFLQQYELSDLL